MLVSRKTIGVALNVRAKVRKRIAEPASPPEPPERAVVQQVVIVSGGVKRLSCTHENWLLAQARPKCC